MLKTLREEQADMRARWSDPSYRWANDSDLRRSKQGRPRGEVAKKKQQEREVDDEV